MDGIVLLCIFVMKRFTGYLVTKFWTKMNLGVSVDSPHDKKRHFLIASVYRTITTPHHQPTRWLEDRPGRLDVIPTRVQEAKILITYFFVSIRPP